MAKVYHHSHWCDGCHIPGILLLALTVSLCPKGTTGIIGPVIVGLIGLIVPHLAGELSFPYQL